MDARFVSGSDIFKLDGSTGWKISATAWTPAGAGLEPQIASGLPSADYAGGELMAEALRDVTMTLPLRYEGDAPAGAQRALEAFLRRGVALKNLEFQVRDDMAFEAEPLWGQWGAWRRYVVIATRPLQPEQTFGVGVRKGWLYANLDLICQPAILGQPQLAGRAKGDVTPAVGADGIYRGVMVADDNASTLALPESALSADGFTLVLVWERDNTALSTSHYLLDGWIELYYSMLGNQWFLSDGSASNSQAIALPAVGSTSVFHIIFDGTNQVDCYINGVRRLQITSSYSAGMTYVTTDAAGTSEFGGVIRMLSVAAGVLTAAEVAADYNNLLTALRAGGSPSPVPYLWTPEGDSSFDNSRFDTGGTFAPQYNYGWLSGVAGSLPAATTILIETINTFGTIKNAWLSLAPFTDKFDVLDHFVVDDSGGTSQSSSTGGAGATQTLGTTWQAATVAADFDSDAGREIMRQLMGRQICMFWRVTGGTAGARQVRAAVQVLAGETVYSAARAANSASGYRLDRTPFVTVPVLDVDILGGSSALRPQHRRTSGSGAAVSDHFTIMVRPLAQVSAASTGVEAVAVREGRAYRVPVPYIFGYTGGITATANAYSRGDVLRAHPNRENLLMVVMGDSTVDPTLGFVATLYIEVTPRWSVV